MTTLGQAYVQIMPSAEGIKKQVENVLGKELNNVGEKSGKNLMSSITKSMSSIGGKMTKAITLPAMGAATAVGGLVSALGFKRLVGMDNAQAKLKGLGVEGKQLEVVMQNTKNAVTGTTHTMADGANVAAGALAAGVKEGADLERYIRLVGDAATGANAPMGDMAQIFNRIQGTGKLMGTELDMIEHRMPGFAQAMAKHLGVAPEEMRKMVSEGKVSSDDFLNVIEGFAGGMSDAFAGTWSGLAKNVLSNIGILGEKMLNGLFGDGKKALESFLEVLRSDDLRNWATNTGVAMQEFAHKIIDVISNLKSRWDNLSEPIQDIIKKTTLFGSLGLVALGPILSITSRIVDGFTKLLLTANNLIMGGFKALAPIIGFLTSPVGLVIAAIGLLTAAIIYLYNESETFRNIVETVFEAVKNVITA